MFDFRCTDRKCSDVVNWRTDVFVEFSWRLADDFLFRRFVAHLTLILSLERKLITSSRYFRIALEFSLVNYLFGFALY